MHDNLSMQVESSRIFLVCDPGSGRRLVRFCFRRWTDQGLGNKRSTGFPLSGNSHIP